MPFTLSCTFTGREENYRKPIVFRAARNEVISEGAIAKLLQLICEVAEIIPYCHFCGFIYLLNVDKCLYHNKEQTPPTCSNTRKI